MRRMVIATLRHSDDLTFLQAQSGLEAIEQLSLGHPDLVVLDLNMPDMHGLEVLRFIRSSRAFATVPVIVLTTRGDDEGREAALDAGATLYRTKPFQPDALSSDVQQLLAGN
jgi:two-component system chemotaxis response regulator CheY